MSDVETPVSGGGADEGKPDGVSASPDPGADVVGRIEGGESDGAAYPNPQTGKAPQGGFMGHGGQTDIAYRGGGQAGEGGDAPNAATGSDSSDGTEEGASPWASPTYEAREVTAGGRTFAVEQTNGIAEAETAGKVGTDARYEAEQASPGPNPATPTTLTQGHRHE